MTQLDPERIYEQIHQVATDEFAEIVISSFTLRNAIGRVLKHRLICIDSSYRDIYYGETGKFSLHWERLHIDGQMYRHDNAPHNRWRSINTFPKHFHNGTQDNVQDSELPDEPIEAIRVFLEFIRQKLVD